MRTLSTLILPLLGVVALLHLVSHLKNNLNPVELYTNFNISQTTPYHNSTAFLNYLTNFQTKLCILFGVANNVNP